MGGEVHIKNCFEVLLSSEANGDIYAAVGFEVYPGEGEFGEDLNGYADNYEIQILIGRKPLTTYPGIKLVSKYKMCWSELTSPAYGPIYVIDNKKIGHGDKWLKVLSNRMVAILTEQVEKILTEDAK